MATGLGFLGQLRLEALCLGGHLEERPSTLRDADGHISNGFDPLGKSPSRHRVLGPGTVREAQ